MANKHQVPVLGGLRKVIRTGENVTPGTTIAEIGDQTVTLAQLAALIGAIQAQNENPGSPTASIALGPGLNGGGPVVGVVPIRLDTLPSVMFDVGGGSDAGGGTDGFMIPGPAGPRGLPGQAVFYIPEDGEDGMMGAPAPIVRGPQGAQGVPGFDGADGEDALMIPGIQGIQGPQGIPGTGGSGSGMGPPGQDGMDGEDAMMIPGGPGIQGLQGIQGLTGASVPGSSGDDGEDGLWIPGQVGSRGLQGFQGATGLEGDTGEDALMIPGNPGSPGTQGIQGLTGASVPGSSGDDGEDGLWIPGPVGSRGLQGFQGATGLEGETGEDALMIPGPPGATTGGGTPASPTNSVQFNNGGSFGGSASLTWDGSQLSVIGPAAGGIGLSLAGASGHGAVFDIIDGGAGGQQYFITCGFTSLGLFAIRDGTRGADVIQISTTGAVVIGATTAGTSLTINNFGTASALALGAATGNPPYMNFTINGSAVGFLGFAGTAGQVGGGSAAGDLVLRTVAGNINFNPNSSAAPAVRIFGSGVVVIAAPSSGAHRINTTSVGLGINCAQIVASVMLRIENNATSDAGFEMVYISTTDWETQTYNRTSSLYVNHRFRALSHLWYASGAASAAMTLNAGLLMAAATGGDQGTGTINATGLFVNGAAVATKATGTFTGTLTGCTTSPTATFNYSITGTVATIDCVLGLSATSNTTSCTITGLPAALTPARQKFVSTYVLNVGGAVTGVAGVSGTTITLTPNPSVIAGFTASGTKGVLAKWSMTFDLA